MKKTKNTDKVIRDGKVAVLVSTGHYMGWSTDNYTPGIEFEPSVVAWVESGKSRDQKLVEELEKTYNGEHHRFYTGGMEGLAIEWVPQGTKLVILASVNRDERLQLIEDFNVVVA